MSNFFDQLMEIATVGENEDGSITRLGGVGPEYEKGLMIAKRQMEEAGLNAEIDPVHNLVGRLPGTDPQAKAIVIGSHLDTVIKGGKFDGVLGVGGGIEVARRPRRKTARCIIPCKFGVSIWRSPASSAVPSAVGLPWAWWTWRRMVMPIV